jgi:hypothetical protein
MSAPLTPHGMDKTNDDNAPEGNERADEGEGDVG